MAGDATARVRKRYGFLPAEQGSDDVVYILRRNSPAAMREERMDLFAYL
jgi:hypothetical protein